MRRVVAMLFLASLGLLAGCHSHYIVASLSNSSAEALNVIQVEYPHASFGTQQLQPGASFNYRFKLLGSGPIKVTFIDAHNTEHSATGPWLNEGQEGTLDVRFTSQAHAEFATSVKP